MYIYQQASWPKFVWNQAELTDLLIHVRHQQGRLVGAFESIGFHDKNEIVLQTITQDIVKSSEIEGEILDPSSVRSSVARRLGLEAAASHIPDRNIDGVVEMMLDATQRFDQPLTEERLFGWHAALFPTGRSGLSKIRVGSWRQGPVEVISGAIGKEKIHFEAPPADHVEDEMNGFLNWLNQESTTDLVVKAAIAHLWFVTIHPFDDGNGRIGRAIVDMMLARSEKSSRRFYSLSSQIQVERKDYYNLLETTQKGDLNITTWIAWFLGCLNRAIEHVLCTLDMVLSRARFWESIREKVINERQRKIINLLLDGFVGKLTSTKWASIAKCSQDTAYRDIQNLLELGILVKNPEGGRSTSYSLRESKNILGK